MVTNIQRLKNNLADFKSEMQHLKETSTVDFRWYRYDTLGNIHHLERLIPASHDFLFADSTRVADIGAGDGDLAFYLETQGQHCDIYDYPPTNMNGLRAARFIKDLRGSNVGIHELNLDLGFKLSAKYDVILFLGILYHLKNPFYVLEQLAQSCRFIVVSTKIARFISDKKVDLSKAAAAYLAGPTELNNDPTNYWVFTDAGLRRILSRAGWEVISYRTVGDTRSSNPWDRKHDERAFVLAKSNRYSG